MNQAKTKSYVSSKEHESRTGFILNEHNFGGQDKLGENTQRKRKIDESKSIMEQRIEAIDNNRQKIARHNIGQPARQLYETQKIKDYNSEWVAANNVLIKMLESSLRQSRYWNKLLSDTLESKYMSPKNT